MAADGFCKPSNNESMDREMACFGAKIDRGSAQGASSPSDSNFQSYNIDVLIGYNIHTDIAECNEKWQTSTVKLIIPSLNLMRQTPLSAIFRYILFFPCLY